MGSFTVGPVVLVRFPVSDLSGAKMRPAVVLASSGNADWILCQITSDPYADENATGIDDTSFVDGALQTRSFFVQASFLLVMRRSLLVALIQGK